MTTWILVVGFTGIQSLFVAHFPTEQACEAATKQVIAKGAGVLPCLYQYQPLPKEPK